MVLFGFIFRVMCLGCFFILYFEDFNRDNKMSNDIIIIFKIKKLRKYSK